MTYILHIETATKVCSVAISKDGVLIEVNEIEDEGYSHGEKLTLLIEEVLRNNQLSPADINAVSVASGPGSYTGLRIGVATAKGLCYALKIPLIAIDSLTALNEQAKLKHPETNLCALIDARRMEVYNLFAHPSKGNLKEISADVIDENTYEEYRPFVYFGDGAEKLKDIWKGSDCEIDSSIKSSASGQVKLAYQKFEDQKFEDVAYFEPFYLKDFIVGKKKS